MANRPATLTAAAAIEAVEGVALIGVGLFVGVETLVARSASVTNAIALAVCAVAVGAALLAVARGLYHQRRWARTPAVLTQLFGFITAIYLLQGHQYAYGFPIALATIAGTLTLFAQSTTKALTD